MFVCFKCQRTHNCACAARTYLSACWISHRFKFINFPLACLSTHSHTSLVFTGLTHIALHLHCTTITNISRKLFVLNCLVCVHASIQQTTISNIHTQNSVICKWMKAPATWQNFSHNCLLRQIYMGNSSTHLMLHEPKSTAKKLTHPTMVKKSS